MGTRDHVAGAVWTQQKTLVLPIPPEQWPPPDEPIEVDGMLFVPKRELHVTVIGRLLGPGLLAEPGRRRVVRKAFQTLDWRFKRTGELLQLEKHELAGTGRGRAIGSIIERIELPAMAEFYEQLALLLERGLAIPPPHVTLYTAGRSQGIGLPDAATLRRLTVGEVPATLIRPNGRHASHSPH